MTSLATADDVARALGLQDSDELTAAQSVRVDDLLARVSRRFRKEAERPFTPSTDTVRLLSVAGRVRLPEPVTGIEQVDSVTMTICGTQTDIDYTLDGQELVCEYVGQPISSGETVTVTYTHSGDVPADVVAEVAAIVARHLTVAPGDGKVVSEAAGPFNARYADWVGSTCLLTEDEVEMARSYRYPGSTVVVHKL
jgi:hypothetical protein